MSSRLICTNCKRKYKVSRWHHRVPTRCAVCGGMLTGDLTAYYHHVVAHPTRYDGGSRHSLRPFAKVATFAFLLGVLLTTVLFTWYRGTQVPRLMAQLASTDQAVWNEAMEALIEVGERAVPALVEAVGGEDEILGERALVALERLGDGAVVPLVKLLVRPDEGVRSSAAGLLPRVSSQQVLPQLATLYLSAKDRLVRSAILGVFEKYPEPSLLGPLIASLDLAARDADQAFNLRVDALCRRILEQLASRQPDQQLSPPPARLEDWPTWLKEHRAELAALRSAEPSQPLRTPAEPEAK